MGCVVLLKPGRNLAWPRQSFPARYLGRISLTLFSLCLFNPATPRQKACSKRTLRCTPACKYSPFTYKRRVPLSHLSIPSNGDIFYASRYEVASSGGLKCVRSNISVRYFINYFGNILRIKNSCVVKKILN